jgi:hypothetical protein
VTHENDQAYFERRAEQDLFMASVASEATIKAIHLDLASRCANLREFAVKDSPTNGSAMIAPMQVTIAR